MVHDSMDKCLFKITAKEIFHFRIKPNFAKTKMVLHL